MTHIIRTCGPAPLTPRTQPCWTSSGGSPIHYFVSMGHNQNGRLIEYSIARYRGDQNRFRVELYRE